MILGFKYEKCRYALFMSRSNLMVDIPLFLLLTDDDPITHSQQHACRFSVTLLQLLVNYLPCAENNEASVKLALP